jgi:hypothetical protein
MNGLPKEILGEIFEYLIGMRDNVGFRSLLLSCKVANTVAMEKRKKAMKGFLRRVVVTENSWLKLFRNELPNRKMFGRQEDWYIQNCYTRRCYADVEELLEDGQEVIFTNANGLQEYSLYYIERKKDNGWGGEYTRCRGMRPGYEDQYLYFGGKTTVIQE